MDLFSQLTLLLKVKSVCLLLWKDASAAGFESEAEFICSVDNVSILWQKKPLPVI